MSLLHQRFHPKRKCFDPLEPHFPRQIESVSFGRFAQRVACIAFYHIAMCGFEAKLVFDTFNKRSTSNRDRFRPAIIAAR